MNLAIKGHTTRGKEVIEILEMLGGKIRRDRLAGNEVFSWYYINGDGYIDYKHYSLFYDTTVFILEKFLEYFPYKVGDKVQHRGATSCGSVYEVEKMRWVDDHVEYEVKRLWCWNDHYTFTAEDLQPYIEETMDKAVFDANAQCCDIMNRLIKKETMEEKLCIGLFPVSNGRKEIIPCDGYEVVSDEGKFYVVKKPQKYPKTHVECCQILYPNENFQTVAQPIKGHNGKKLFALQKLLVCRDAYWKIAGEQMGLGKPWKPDWDDKGNATIKYCICISGNVISKDKFYLTNFILSFPTEEMRDAFYENFNVLIEICKELL